MKRISLILTLFCLCFSLSAQHCDIKGKVFDSERNEALAFANCILRYKTDTLGIYKGVASDTNGCFIFKNIKKRDLILEIQYVGFEKYKKEIPAKSFEKGKDIDLGTILLQFLGDLNEVVVTAQRKRIEIDDDKLTMNIDEGMANMVSNAFDLLRLVPGVMIDNEENIKLNGKSGVAFQYNGRDMKLEWEAIKDMLKSMSPEMIDGYEILKNPGVKYDADGTAGIINIKLKKNQHYGINGSVGISLNRQDEYDYGYRPSARLNFVNDKWIISGGYSFNEQWNGEPAKADSSIRYMWIGTDTTLFRNISEEKKSKRFGHGFNFSASYSLDSTSTLGFSANYGIRQSPESFYDNPMLISHNPNYYTPDSAYNSLSGNKSNSDWLSLGLSYVKKLDSLDSKISSDLDFSMRNSVSNSLNQTDYYTYKYGNTQNVFDSIYRSQGYKRENENKTKNISWRIDYFKPINKQMRFEAGFKTNFSSSNRDYDSKVLSSGTYINNAMESNEFNYFENINSLYASLTNKFFDRKLSLRIGIRLEQTNTKGEQKMMDTTLKQNYFNFFPNLRISYKFKEDNELSFNYSYRIWRPWSESLNPFVSRSSDYSYSTGNPALKPEGSHHFSLSHSFKYVLFTSIDYSRSNNEINYFTIPLDDSYPFTHSPLATISYPINQGHSDNVRLDVSLSKNIFQDLYLSANGGVDYSHVEASMPKEEISRENWAYFMSVNTFVNLPKKWRLSAFYFYHSSNIDAISKSNGWQWLSANVGKSFFEDKFSLNLSCNWSLNHRSRSETRYDNMLLKSWNRATPPNFNFSITWKFGKFYKNKQIQKQQLENFDDRKGGGEE